MSHGQKSVSLDTCTAVFFHCVYSIPTVFSWFGLDWNRLDQQAEEKRYSKSLGWIEKAAQF